MQRKITPATFENYRYSVGFLADFTCFLNQYIFQNKNLKKFKEYNAFITNWFDIKIKIIIHFDQRGEYKSNDFINTPHMNHS